MGVTSIIVGLGLVFAPESARTVRPVVVEPAVDDVVDGPRLHAPDLSFLRPSMLRILGEGRFGTWSLFGSTIGAAPGSLGCRDALGVDCAPVALAELGLAWRPHGSRVSLFAAVAVASLAALRQSVGMQVVGGLRIDLPRWLGGNVPGARR